MAAAVVLLLLVRIQFRLAVVMGDSMLPVLRNGDLLLIDRRSYRRTAPKRGDIVVARYRDDLVVKRVVGLPGEEVAVKRGHVYVNGTALAEHHPIEPGALDISAGTIFPGKLALLGDNRALGWTTVSPVVSRDQLIGKVIWSLHWRVFERKST